jgi:hypothetical protein
LSRRKENCHCGECDTFPCGHSADTLQIFLLIPASFSVSLALTRFFMRPSTATF